MAVGGPATVTISTGLAVFPDVNAQGVPGKTYFQRPQIRLSLSLSAWVAYDFNMPTAGGLVSPDFGAINGSIIVIYATKRINVFVVALNEVWTESRPVNARLWVLAGANQVALFTLCNIRSLFDDTDVSFFLGG